MSKRNPTSSRKNHPAVANPASVAPFVYRPAPGWAGVPEKDGSPDAAVNLSGASSVATGVAEPGTKPEKSSARGRELWDEGFREGTARARAEFEMAMNQQRDAIADALKTFGKERNAYFHQVEGEVVALALAIVRKVLRREAQVDPLLLSGLVRVALEKTSVSQTARLRVHPSQISIWQDHFAQQTDMPLVPELVGDASLEESQCRLETEVGVTELNLETQLKEIEQGLFDLLAQRPAPR